MQAQVSRKHFGFGRLGNSMAALGVAAALLVGAAGLAIVDRLSTSDTTTARVTRQLPIAHTSPLQGDGLVTSAHLATAAQPKLVAIDNAYMGEGIVGGNRDIFARKPIIAYGSVGQGEGWIGHGSPTAETFRPTVVAVEGQGEGWLAYGRPADATEARSDADTVKAPGEGIVGGSGTR